MKLVKIFSDTNHTQEHSLETEINTWLQLNDIEDYEIYFTQSYIDYPSYVKRSVLIKYNDPTTPQTKPEPTNKRSI